jgi:hypothetical protein
MLAATSARALVLAGIALALQAMAEAKGPCPVMSTMLAENPKRLKGIAVAINGAGTMDLTMNGTADALRGAESCNLYGPADELGIDCDWSYNAGEDADARRDFAALMGRLEACLPTPLERREPVTYSEQQLAEAAQRSGPSYADYLRSREVLADYKQTYPLDRENEHELTVSVSLVRDRNDGSLRLDVSLSRD